MYVDTTNRAAPVVRHTVPSPASYYSQLDTRGGDIFISAAGAGLQIYRLDASQLGWVAERGMKGLSRAGSLLDGYLYLAQDIYGVAKLRVTDPGGPVLVDTRATGAWARGLAVLPPYLIVIDDNRVVVLDPASLSPVASLTLPGDATYTAPAALAGNTLFVLGTTAGLCVVDLARASRAGADWLPR